MATHRRVKLAFLTLIVALSAFVFSPTPDASAQDDPVEYASHLILAGTATCPDGFDNVGTVTDGGFNATFCEPDGFVPITTEADCLAVEATWLDDGSLTPVCGANGYQKGTPDCQSPFVVGEGTSPGGFFTVWCVVRPLVSGSSSGSGYAGIPVCIESDFVATNAAEAQVGSEFYGDDGLAYFIHTGPPTCEVNCHSGFDFNCDDVLGDFCSADLNLNLVADVQTCLADMAPAEPVALTTDVASVPAAPAAIPVSAASGPMLAHTGAEADLLAYLGFGLVAFGATAMGVRRRMAD